MECGPLYISFWRKPLKQDRNWTASARRPRYWLLWMSLQFTPWPLGCWSWAASGSSAPPMPCCWSSTAGAPPCWEAMRVASNPKRSLPCKLWRLNWRKCWVLTSSLKIGLGHIRLIVWIPTSLCEHSFVMISSRCYSVARVAALSGMPTWVEEWKRVSGLFRKTSRAFERCFSALAATIVLLILSALFDMSRRWCRARVPPICQLRIVGRLMASWQLPLGESLPLMWERWQANVSIRAYDNTCCRLLQHGSVAVVVLKTFASKSGCFFHLVTRPSFDPRKIHVPWRNWVVREITLHWAGGMWKCWRRSLSPSFCQVGSDQNPWWLVLIAGCTVGVINVYWGLSWPSIRPPTNQCIVNITHVLYQQVDTQALLKHGPWAWTWNRWGGSLLGLANTRFRDPNHPKSTCLSSPSLLEWPLKWSFGGYTGYTMANQIFRHPHLVLPGPNIQFALWFHATDSLNPKSWLGLVV